MRCLVAKKARFKPNTTKSAMQQFMHVDGGDFTKAYMPISGFTAPDLGYQKGDAVSNFVTEFDASVQRAQARRVELMQASRDNSCDRC